MLIVPSSYTKAPEMTISRPLHCPDPNTDCTFWESFLNRIFSIDGFITSFLPSLIGVLVVFYFVVTRRLARKDTPIAKLFPQSVATDNEEDEESEGDGLSREQFFGRLRGLRVKYAGGGYERVLERELRDAEVEEEGDRAREREEEPLLEAQRRKADDLERQAKAVIWRT